MKSVGTSLMRRTAHRKRRSNDKIVYLIRHGQTEMNCWLRDFRIRNGPNVEVTVDEDPLLYDTALTTDGIRGALRLQDWAARVRIPGTTPQQRDEIAPHADSSRSASRPRVAQPSPPLTARPEAPHRQEVPVLSQANPRPEVVLVSPLSRALHTADIAFAGQKDIPRHVEPLATEKVWHSSDVGSRKKDLEAKWGDIYDGSGLDDVWWYTGGTGGGERAG